MIIDFHTHSHASDGALSPSALLADAIAAGVQQFAITDHDTVNGYLELRDAGIAMPPGFNLVAGTELSCVWSNVTIHVVGLGMDVEHPVMMAGLERLDRARAERAVIIGRRLEKLGMPGALEGALEEAGVSQIGRPHFAAWMLQEGHVKDANEAFDKHLGAGKRGDVKTCWPTLAEATDWISAAGGRAILAHPLKYRMTNMKLRRCLRDFITAGGAGLEVWSGRQNAEQTRYLCQLARDFELPVSAGSDFHAPGEYAPGLGFDTAGLPDDIELILAEQPQ
jgi:predicted metal-dependent phosphoesterase TrpH